MTGWCARASSAAEADAGSSGGGARARGEESGQISVYISLGGFTVAKAQRVVWKMQEQSRSVSMYQTVCSRQVEEVISTSGRGLAMFPHEAECMIRRRGRGSAMSLCAMFKLEGERPLFRSLCHYVVRGYRAVGLYRAPLAPFRLLRLSKSARSSQQLQEKLENLVHHLILLEGTRSDPAGQQGSRTARVPGPVVSGPVAVVASPVASVQAQSVVIDENDDCPWQPVHTGWLHDAPGADSRCTAISTPDSPLSPTLYE